jgi:hypothetical protein
MVVFVIMIIMILKKKRERKKCQYNQWGVYYHDIYIKKQRKVSQSVSQSVGTAWLYSAVLTVL